MARRAHIINSTYESGIPEFVKPIHAFFSREEQRDRIILMRKADTYRPGIRPSCQMLFVVVVVVLQVKKW